MNERSKRTFYITIDADSANTIVRGDDVSARHAAREMKRVGRTPFRVDITEDENGKPHFEFTELEEPKQLYRICAQNVEACMGWIIEDGCTMQRVWEWINRSSDQVSVHPLDENGRALAELTDSELAKVIEEWKNQ